MSEPTDFFGKMKQSLKGVLVGIVLIPLSFFLVYLASQREQASEVLKDAMPFEKAEAAAQKNKAVYMTGTLQAEPFGDGYIEPGPYLRISRTAQMYAYVSRETTKDVQKDGKTVKETVYTCVEEWTSDPARADDGKGCKDEKKYNPDRSLVDFRKDVTPSLLVNGTAWELDESVDYTDMPGLDLSKSAGAQYSVKGSYLYIDAACNSTSPRIGCERFSYSGISYDPTAQYTAIGVPVQGRIVGFESSEGNSYLKLGPGTFTDVMESLHASDTTGTWLWFGGAVLCLGFGLSMLVGPFLELIEHIPLIGGFGAGLIRVILFIVSAIVIGLSFLLIEYWYIVLILFVVGIIAATMMAKRRKTAKA